jgi:glutamine synthetase adenylyltransferase
MFLSVLSVANLSATEGISWDIAKQIIQTQSNITIIGISVLVGIALLISGASWLTNFYLARRRLENILESHKLEIVSMAQESFKEYMEIIKKEVENAKEEIKESIEQEMTEARAEMSRLHARDSEQEEAWEIAALWWSRAIKDYAEATEGALLRVSVEGLKKNLEKCEDLDTSGKEEIRSILPKIPRTLWLEKTSIEEILNTFPKAREDGTTL